MRTYKEILSDVVDSCYDVLFSGCKNNYAEVIEAATKIYIAELQMDRKFAMLDEDGFPIT